MKQAKGPGSTIARKGLVVLQDPTFIDQSLLLGRNVAAPSDNNLERLDGRIKRCLDREFGPIGTPDVDGGAATAVSHAGTACVAGISVGTHARQRSGFQTLNGDESGPDLQSERGI